MFRLRLCLFTIAFMTVGCSVTVQEEPTASGISIPVQLAPIEPASEEIAETTQPKEQTKPPGVELSAPASDSDISKEQHAALLEKKKPVRKQKKTASKKKAAKRDKVAGGGFFGGLSNLIGTNTNSVNLGVSDTANSGSTASYNGALNSTGKTDGIANIIGGSEFDLVGSGNSLFPGDPGLNGHANEVAPYEEPASASRAEEAVANGSSVNNLENYSVIVAADKEITIPGPPGKMNVWIGSQASVPNFGTTMNTKGKEIPALSDWAMVTPFTPGIEVEPKVSGCLEIHPSGSEVRFQLKPSTTGTFSIGADVALYSSNDCSGSPIPKTAASIQVQVVVNTMKIIEEGRDEIVSETWKGVLGFWKEFVGLISALLLFLIRKKLYKWFGFKTEKEA